MKKLETNHNGGLRLNWDDIRWGQNGIIESLDKILMALGKQTTAFILSGCETRLWVNYGNESGSYIDFRLSSGVVCLNGELFTFSGFQQPAELIVSTTKFWFAVDTAYNPLGVKTDQYYQEEHQCHADRYAKIIIGANYPAGVDGVDYFSIVKHSVNNTPNLLYLYEILQENLQKKTVVATGITAIGSIVNVQNIRLVKNGNICQLSGYISFSTADALAEGYELLSVPHQPWALAVSPFEFCASVVGVSNAKTVPLRFVGNKLVVGDSIDVGVATQIKLGVTFITQ